VSQDPADPVSGTAPYLPGSPLEELDGTPGDDPFVRLASNENPLGPSPRAVEAARAALGQVHRYPDAAGRRLRSALSRKFQVTPDQILLGNGSTELVELLARAFLGRDGWAVMAEQTFVMYRIAVQAVNGQAREIPLRGSRYDLDAMAAACDDRTVLVYLANPDNPTGTYVTREELERYFSRVPPGVLTALDEAYAEYLDRDDYPSGLDFLRQGRRVAVLRTFSKAYGLAGLRMGFALAPPGIISALERVRSPFNTSRVAQAAALHALEEAEHLQRSRELVREGREYLEQEFRRRGLSFIPSVTNFVLVDVRSDAEEIHRRLLQRGIIVRPMAPYRFPTSLRVTVGTSLENRRFLEALDEVLGSLGALSS